MVCVATENESLRCCAQSVAHVENGIGVAEKIIIHRPQRLPKKVLRDD